MTPQRVVVVNDDPVQLRSFSGILQGAGYAVRGYLNAPDAFAALTGDEAGVDLFVLDLHMPGIDGWKLCRLLRSPAFPRYNDTPILIASATFAGDDVESITRELGASAFLQAPFTAERLVEFAGAVLRGERPSAPPLVLIVDDDADITRALTRTFEGHGYEVRGASSGAEAAAVWGGERVDVVLLDYHLPDGSCEGLLDRFYRPDAATAILVMTGDSDPSLPVSLLDRGADGYLRKPFDVEFAVVLARRASRERSLLRVEGVLEARTRELRASEQRYRSLFETVPDLMLVLDETHHILEANAEAAYRLSVSDGQLVGRSLLDFVHEGGGPAMARGIERIVREGCASFDAALRTSGGAPLPVEIAGRTMELDDSRGVLLVARDISEWLAAEDERRQLENRLQQAQRLESLGVLAGGVAHDFNNLLVGILGNASLALTDIRDDSPLRDGLVQIEVAARRAAELTNQILTFAGKSSVAEEPILLPELVREMGRLVEPAISKKARLTYRLAPGTGTVLGDAGQVRQLVMNLIINASDALEGEPGAITVATGVREMDGPDLATAVGSLAPLAGTYAFVDVADDGVGMSPETLARIFEPFFTTKDGGRGLGLAAALGIVRAHRGYMLVDSQRGRGTTFSVLLPVLDGDDDGVEESQPGERGEVPWTGGGRVLIVDDEVAVRGLARAVLSRNGFEVLEAEDGAAGLEAIGVEHADLDLVLLDLTMPRVSGLEVLESLRRDHPELPVILSSGYAEDTVPEPLLRKGPTGFVGKPYAPVDLMRAVSSVLVPLGGGAVRGWGSSD